MIVVIINEKNQGIPSSGIQFCFWGALVIYASIKLRTLILIRKDRVCSHEYIVCCAIVYILPRLHDLPFSLTA